MVERIEALLKQMTLEEKVSMLAGADMWHTQGVERLGIPAIKMSDGPNGARGGSLKGDVTSACFPVGIALASTWNIELVERVGAAPLTLRVLPFITSETEDASLFRM